MTAASSRACTGSPGFGRGRAPWSTCSRPTPRSCPATRGGALVAADGRVIGINVAYLPPAGGAVSIGFAVPSPTVLDVVGQLLRHPPRTHTPISASSPPADPADRAAIRLEHHDGVVVVDVGADAPAGHRHRAGRRRSSRSTRSRSGRSRTSGRDVPPRARRPGDDDGGPRLQQLGSKPSPTCPVGRRACLPAGRCRTAATLPSSSRTKIETTAAPSGSRYPWRVAPPAVPAQLVRMSRAGRAPAGSRGRPSPRCQGSQSRPRSRHVQRGLLGQHLLRNNRHRYATLGEIADHELARAHRRTFRVPPSPTTIADLERVRSRR